jgi:hypothetical protein
LRLEDLHQDQETGRSQLLHRLSAARPQLAARLAEAALPVLEAELLPRAAEARGDGRSLRARGPRCLLRFARGELLRVELAAVVVVVAPSETKGKKRSRG